MKKRVLKHVMQIVLLLSLTAFALWFALKDDYQSVFHNLRHVSLKWMVLILFFGIVYYMLQGIVLYLIGKQYKPGLRIRDGVHNAYIAAFFNGVTPLGGGQVAQTYAFRKLGMQYNNIASVLWIDFFLYQSVVIAYVGILLLLKFKFALFEFHGYFLLIILGFLINASVVVGLWTMSKFPKFYMKMSAYLVYGLSRLNIIKHQALTIEKWKQQILYFNSEIKNLGKHRTLILQGVCLNIIRLTIYYILPFIIAYALHIPMHINDIITVVALSAFIHMLNALTPLPGDTGWTESAFIIIFATMFGRVEASSVMILWRSATYHVQLLIGGGVFLYVKAKKNVPMQQPQDSVVSDAQQSKLSFVGPQEKHYKKQPLP